eukprot:TRINITY_DN12224_c0_g1_i1.p1 TRINITY_DN12224_c0_g1~~TRINITY_DN12224_c0_g1_i1.p1  ORF type:complete len:90 (+),score=22.56 TRINITY_DN12224_c0_g1_i1:231-500(+)
MAGFTMAHRGSKEQEFLIPRWTHKALANVNTNEGTATVSRSGDVGLQMEGREVTSPEGGGGGGGGELVKERVVDGSPDLWEGHDIGNEE